MKKIKIQKQNLHLMMM